MEQKTDKINPFTQYFKYVMSNAFRVLYSLPMRFFWGMFILLSFIMIIQAAIIMQIIEDKVLGLIIGYLLGIFFTPLEFMQVIFMKQDFSHSGGIINLLVAVGTWLAIIEFLRALRKKFFPGKSDSLVPDIWSMYKTRMKFVSAVFIFCVLINLISANYEGVFIYLLVNLFVMPFSLGIVLYNWCEQNLTPAIKRSVDANVPTGTMID